MQVRVSSQISLCPGFQVEQLHKINFLIKYCIHLLHEPAVYSILQEKTALRKSDERDITGAPYDITMGGFSEVIHAAASEKAGSWALSVTDTSYC